MIAAEGKKMKRQINDQENVYPCPGDKGILIKKTISYNGKKRIIKKRGIAQGQASPLRIPDNDFENKPDKIKDKDILQEMGSRRADTPIRYDQNKA